MHIMHSIENHFPATFCASCHFLNKPGPCWCYYIMFLLICFFLHKIYVPPQQQCLHHAHFKQSSFGQKYIPIENLYVKRAEWQVVQCVFCIFGYMCFTGEQHKIEQIVSFFKQCLLFGNLFIQTQIVKPTVRNVIMHIGMQPK